MKFRIEETIHSEKVKTVRLGTKAEKFTKADIGKAVKLGGDSQYVKVDAGDAIEGYVTSVEVDQGLFDGYHLGGIISTGYKNATVVGAAVAVKDYVVAAAPTAIGTKLTTPVGVTKAADQAVAAAAPFKARVVSLGDAGTGAAGTVVVLELF